MTYSFNDQLKKDSEEYGVGGKSGDYYQLEEGPGNIVRVLTPGQAYGQHFFGKGVKPTTCYGYEKGCPIREKDFKYDHPKPTLRYNMLVIDRKDGNIKVATFPYTVVAQIGELQKNPDFSFDDLPMPYDIRINWQPNEAPAKKYTVTGKPKIEELTEEEKTAFNEMMEKSSPEQIVERMKEKQIKIDEENNHRKSPEQLEDEQKKRKEEYEDSVKESMAKAESKPAKPEVEYPTEEIDPDDIPF